MEESEITYSEDDLLPLSGLQHMLFCERQCALIHVEQIWMENRLTAEGRIMHERVHNPDKVSRGDIKVEYAMPLRSLKLGLIAKADVVEFHRKKGAGDSETEKWQPFPVEYKRGKPKKDNSDKVQLCAQAMCLEEMLDVKIAEGAIFYGKTRRRQDIVFDEELRKITRETAERFHKLVAKGQTPKPVFMKRCHSCSVYDVCLPRMVEKGRAVNDYINDSMREL
jgi:CRISPR-associated exonuclease Cas4